MGMFDNVICKAKLPDDAFPPGHLFQTKSLDRCLDEYQITEDGKLVRISNEAAKPDETLDFHGDIEFYDLEPVVPLVKMAPHPPKLITYRARFTEGALARIERLP